MKRTLMLIVFATLAAFGQKIETQKPDRKKITRLATTQNHLSVIEFNEPVKEVAVGSSTSRSSGGKTRSSSSRSNPTPPPTCSSGPPPAVRVTNWCRQARSDEMHFAIDQDPAYRSGEEGRSGRQARRRTTQGTRGHADGEHARQGCWFLKKPPESGDRAYRMFTRRTAVSTFGTPS